MSYILFATYGNLEAQKAAAILTEAGHTVIITSNGKEALEVIAKNSEMPTVIFAHILLPELDGEELTYFFRRDYADAKTKILIATVKSSQEGGGIRNWNAPVEGYVMGSYSADQLVLSVEQLLYRNVTAL